MKKHVLIVLAAIFFVGVTAKAISYSLSTHFIDCLSTCEKFTHDDGRKITVIMGWTNRKCYFQEITHNRTIMCALKPLELAHFTQEIRKEHFDYDKGLVSAVRVRPYFQSLDTCTVKTRNNQKF
ncbi:hypothetical protein IJ425_02345 [bacterium]|nr:hypothetical protein [bacterium]